MTATQESPAPHILVVEDDDLLRRSIQKFLGMMRYRVTGVVSAEEALQQLGRKTIDLILTDYQLTGLSGLDLAGMLHREGVGLPVVLMSAYVNDDMKANAARVGVQWVLAKPMVMRALDGVCARALQSSPARGRAS